MSPPPPPPPPSSSKPPLSSLLSTYDFLSASIQSLPPKPLAFLTSAATDSHTHRSNTQTYSLLLLRPRVLIPVGAPISLSTTLLSRDVSSPVYASPTSLGKLFHPNGEREIAAACANLGIAQVISTSASFALEEICCPCADPGPGPGGGGTTTTKNQNHAAAAAPPKFFQLYMDKNRSGSARLLRSLKRLKIGAVFLTVDAPVAGKREADERVPIPKGDEHKVLAPMAGTRTVPDDSKDKDGPGGGDGGGGGPDGGGGGGALGRVMGSYVDPATSWSDVEWIRRQLLTGEDQDNNTTTTTPATARGTARGTAERVKVVLKGIQTAADAKRAMEAGVDGIVISNHGGRSLDTSTPTILVLLEMQKLCPEVFDAIEVHIDGGVMRGTDVFKALCLGAKGVGIGRGVLYGLNYGREGVERYVQILNEELKTTMRMCGVTKLEELHPGFVNTGAVDHLIPAELGEEHPYAKWRRKGKGNGNGNGSKL